MQNYRNGDRLSWGDTVFLHLEREDMPLNVASVCVFEGQISSADCSRFIESKLSLIPRYLKRVVSAPFGLGLPSWEFDPNFDINRHISEVTLKQGTDAELKTLAGKLFSRVMDRRHPLWDVRLVHGLKGDRTAIIFRLHHCLADGIAGVGIMNVLLDTKPEAPVATQKRLRLSVPPPPDPLTSFVGGCVDSYSDFVKRLLSALTDLLSMSERAAATSRGLPTDEFSRLLPEISAFTQRLRFNVPYRGPQKFTWADIPLAEIKAIKHACCTSVNDVILALITATVRQYSEWHGDRVKGRLLRMMVPVNLRGNESPNELGNRISLVPVTIPLDIRDPRRLLTAVHERTEFLKYSHAAELVSLAGGMIGMFPTSLQAMIGPALSQLPITPFNLVCTNVPGPQYPLYVMGHKMVSWYPYVPVGGEMAANCAILSYNGTVFFGFSADRHAVPDLRRFEKFLQASFEDLRAATLNGTQKRRKKSRNPIKPGAAVKSPEPGPVQTSIPSSNFNVAVEPKAKSITEKSATQLIA